MLDLPTISYRAADPHVIPRRLRTLSTLQYVGAGLVLIQLPISLWLRFRFFWYSQGNAGSPNVSIFLGFIRNEAWNFIPYLSWCAIMAALTIHSARQMTRRRWRIYSVVVSALTCILFPLGTLFGLSTIIALFTNSFKQLYSCPAPSP